MVWQLSSVVLVAGQMVVRCHGPVPCCPRGGDIYALSRQKGSLEELQPMGKESRELFSRDLGNILIVGSKGYLVVLSACP